MAVQLPLPDLIQKMKGVDTLNGWDVLVSYTDTMLNKLLEERAAKMGTLSPVSWQAVFIEPSSQGEFDFKITMTMSSPTIHFSDSDGSVRLRSRISGSYSLASALASGEMVMKFPDKLELVLDTSLVHMTGTWDDGFQPSSLQKNPPDWITVIEGDSHQCHSVTLNFTDLSASVVNGPDGDTDSDFLAMFDLMISDFIVQHFQTSVGLKLSLAALSNSYDTAFKENQVLKPASFCFTVTKGNPSSNPPVPGALNMWIALQGGPNNGRHPSGQTKLSFAPQGLEMTPLPAGNEATIIFSSHTMANLFLKPALSQYVDNVVSLAPPAEGIAGSFNFRDSRITVPAIRGKGEEEFECPGAAFNMCQPAARFSFTGALVHEGNSPLSLEYSSPEQTMNWSYTHWAGSDMTMHKKTDRGTVFATFSLQGHGQWRGSSDPQKRPNELGLQIEFNDKFKFTARPDSKSWFETNKSDKVPYQLNSIATPSPHFSVDIAMDYFLTTNILLPGQYVFKADNPVAPSGQADHGLAMPRDTILTGKINMDSTAAAIRDANLKAHANLLGDPPGPKTSKDFLNDLVASPPKRFLFDLWNAANSGDPDAGQKGWDILKANGYSGLTADGLMNLFQMASDSAWKQFLDPANKPEKLTSAPFDLRAFGGTYQIRSPGDDEGTILKVNSHAGAIMYEGTSSSPTITHDESSGTTWVQFHSRNRQFKITFDAFFDPVTALLTGSFRGTVTGEDGSAQDFSGTQSNAGPPLELLRKAVSRKKKGIVVMVGINDDVYQRFLEVLSIASTVFALVTWLISYYWRSQDKKESSRLGESLKASERALEDMKKDIETVVANSTRAGVRDFLTDPRSGFSGLRTTFDEAVRTAIQKSLDGVSEVAIRNAVNTPDLINSLDFQAVRETAETAIETTLTQQIQSFSRTRVNDLTAGFLQSGFLNTNDLKPFVESVLNPIIEDRVREARRDTILFPSYLKFAVSSEILGQKAKLLARDREGKQRDLSNLQERNTVTQKEVRSLQEKLDISREDLESKDPTSDEAKVIQEQIKNLQEEIDTRQKELDRQADEIQKKQREVDETERQRTETVDAEAGSRNGANLDGRSLFEFRP